MRYLLIALLLVVAETQAQKIRFRRMTEAAKDTLTYHTVLSGEGVYCTDSKKFYIFGTDSAFYAVGPGAGVRDTMTAFAFDILPDAANTRDLGSRDKPLDTVYARGVRRAEDESGQNLFLVQDMIGMLHTNASSSTGFTQTKNDSIYIWGRYLDAPAKLGKIAFYTGALTGSAPVRTVSVGVYNASRQRVDTTAATTYAASQTMPMSFVNGASVGPGWVYFCFSVYFSTTGTFKFNVVNVDINYGAASILTGQSTTFPVVGWASESLSAGTGWPATITPNRNINLFQFPAMMVWGSDVD